MGYSDVGALLLALSSRSGLVTFHGPMGISSWDAFTRAEARRVVLLLEEVREPASEIDRMLTQLQMAGVLERARAIVFGQLPGCVPPRMDPAVTVDRVPVEVDADRGTIRMLERAVA